MSSVDEHEVTFSVAGGIFGVGRLATRLKGLCDTDQIGPWHIGQWLDFRHTAIRIKFGTVEDGETATRACIDAAPTQGSA